MSFEGTLKGSVFEPAVVCFPSFSHCQQPFQRRFSGMLEHKKNKEFGSQGFERLFELMDKHIMANKPMILAIDSCSRHNDNILIILD